METESVKLGKDTLDDVRKIAKKERRTLIAQLSILVYDGIEMYKRAHSKEKPK
jgi:hypothetical protein